MDLYQARKLLIDNFRKTSTVVHSNAALKFVSNQTIESTRWGSISFNYVDFDFRKLNPSVSRYLHGWIFLGPWLGEARQSKRVLCALLEYTNFWVERFLDVAPDADEFRVVYHDEATAQRLLIAIQIHQLISGSSVFMKERAELQRMMQVSAGYLISDFFYSGNNNHGMFQSIAVRDYAVYANWLDIRERAGLVTRACKRILDYFNSSFTEEGVHIEHSPTYHLLIVRKIREHINFLESSSIRVPDSLRLIIGASANHAIHCVQPDGRFLPLSDSEQGSLVGKSHNVFESAEFEYAVSQGKSGISPADRTLYEPESGYFFHRNSWQGAEASYLAFIAAYNGNYHKHSDDLHLYLWKNGVELLSEAGPYGYRMKDPYVRYGFSQFAHNGIIVDNQSLPRTDDRSDFVRMLSFTQDSSVLSVAASNSRFDNVVHHRDISFDDGIDIVTVIDDLNSNMKHEYSLVWNVGFPIRLVEERNTVTCFIDDLRVMRLVFSSTQEFDISIIQGRDGANPRGWRFPKFGLKVPTGQIVIKSSGTDVKFTTHVYVDDFSISDSRLDKLSAMAEVAVSGSGGSLPAKLPNEVSSPSGIRDMLKSVTSLLVTKDGLSIVSGVVPLRGLVRLYRSASVVGEQRGDLTSISWDGLEPGKYRARVFPKGAHARSEPFTTAWIHFPG